MIRGNRTFLRLSSTLGQSGSLSQGILGFVMASRTRLKSATKLWKKMQEKMCTC